jgi:hypothetical protein
MDEQRAQELAEQLRTIADFHHDVQVDGLTVKARIGGYDNTAESVLNRYTNCWDKACVIDANDTVDAGDAKVLQAVSAERGDTTEIASATGAEGAMARDVASELSEHMEANPTPR